LIYYARHHVLANDKIQQAIQQTARNCWWKEVAINFCPSLRHETNRDIYLATAVVYQPSARTLASRMNGRKGGIARAAKLTAEKRKQIASKAGTACRDGYGNEFYSYLHSKKKKK
jgi:hypothetical protein